MIRIFGATDKTFTTNGDKVVTPLKAKVHKQDNGDYYLDLETDLSYIDYLVTGNIIVADTPQGDQAFRVTNPQKTKNKITVRAWHVFYDSQNYLISSLYTGFKNCEQALMLLNEATEPASEFSVASDVSDIHSYVCVRQSLQEAIMGVLEAWGGHLVRDNFLIEIRESIGQDNGAVVRYRKNIKEISCSEDWDSVVTKLMPVGKDGILLNALDPTVSPYIESEIQYSVPYTKSVEFSQDIEEDDYPSQYQYKQALLIDLRQQANAYIEQHCLPEVSYTLKANLEQITDIGDVVEVIDERLGVNMMTTVNGYDWDCLLKKYTEIEFGNFKRSLSDLLTSIRATVNKDTQKQVQAVKTQIAQTTGEIWSTLEGSYVVNEGSQTLLVDSLPKESAVHVLRLGNDGISFSSNGINGDFHNAWDINSVMSLGGAENVKGQIELLDDSGTVLGELNSDGIFLDGKSVANVQADWAETDISSDAYILNKPSVDFNALANRLTALETKMTAYEAQTSFTCTRNSSIDAGEAFGTYDPINKKVIITGWWNHSATLASSTVLFTVPSVYRPSENKWGSTNLRTTTQANNPRPHHIRVNASGQIQQVLGSAVYAGTFTIIYFI